MKLAHSIFVCIDHIIKYYIYT